MDLKKYKENIRNQLLNGVRAQIKLLIANKIIYSLQDDIKELLKEGNLSKVIKRFFSLAIVQGKMNEDILHLLNSDYGIFYKFINFLFLGLIMQMLEQTFKSIPMKKIKINMEYIKEFANHVTLFDVDDILDSLYISLNSITRLK